MDTSQLNFDWGIEAALSSIPASLPLCQTTPGLSPSLLADLSDEQLDLSLADWPSTPSSSSAINVADQRYVLPPPLRPGFGDDGSAKLPRNSIFHSSNSQGGIGIDQYLLVTRVPSWLDTMDAARPESAAEWALSDWDAEAAPVGEEMPASPEPIASPSKKRRRSASTANDSPGRPGRGHDQNSRGGNVAKLRTGYKRSSQSAVSGFGTDDDEDDGGSHRSSPGGGKKQQRRGSAGETPEEEQQQQQQQQREPMSHNEVERNYRQRLNSQFSQLLEAMAMTEGSSGDGDKSSSGVMAAMAEGQTLTKGAVLDLACRRLRALHEEKIALQEAKAALLRELKRVAPRLPGGDGGF